MGIFDPRNVERFLWVFVLCSTNSDTEHFQTKFDIVSDRYLLGYWSRNNKTQLSVKQSDNKLKQQCVQDISHIIFI